MNDAEKLTKIVDNFCEYMQSLPAEQTRQQVWGAREVLAHLVYHHELYVRLAEACLAKANASPPRGRFSDINTSAVEENLKYSIKELITRFKHANPALSRFTNTMIQTRL